MRKAVYEYFRSKDGFLLDTKIVIHTFANISGLSKTYQEARIVADSTAFRQFLHGFNKEHALCYFIDAGDDKEAADNKVKGVLNDRFANKPDSSRGDGVVL